MRKELREKYKVGQRDRTPQQKNVFFYFISTAGIAAVTVHRVPRDRDRSRDTNRDHSRNRNRDRGGDHDRQVPVYFCARGSHRARWSRAAIAAALIRNAPYWYNKKRSCQDTKESEMPGICAPLLFACEGGPRVTKIARTCLLPR